MNHRVDTLAIVALGILLLIALLPSAAYATDVQPCQINSWSPIYPNQVNPGQTIQVTSTINIACGQWRTYYTARVDLVNRATGQWYSTSEFQIGWQPDVNATITNAATAPQTSGEWKLQYNLYIFEEGSQDGNPFHNTFNINVGGSGTSSSTTQQKVTSNASNASSVMSQTTTSAASNDPPSTTYVAVTLAGISLLGLVVLSLTRKRDERASESKGGSDLSQLKSLTYLSELGSW